MNDQTYTIISKITNQSMGEVTFPKDIRNANFGSVCFYIPETDSFRGTTDVGDYVVVRHETCKECGDSFAPEWGEYARCQSCLADQHSAAEVACGVE